MRFRFRETCSLSVAAVLMGLSSAYAASPVAGFGPAVTGGASLQANLNSLQRVVAWQNSPDGDIFLLALSTPAPELPFENVAMQTASIDRLDSGPDIFNDVSLNASLRALDRAVAWRATPEGDAFAYALQQLDQPVDFERVALASVPAGGFETGD